MNLKYYIAWEAKSSKMAGHTCPSQGQNGYMKIQKSLKIKVWKAFTR